MSALDDHKEEIEHYEQMLGTHRGRLGVTLDRVTNTMVLVGQRGVYCHSQRDPTKPTMDIQIITEVLRKAKELNQSVMEEMRAERENRLGTKRRGMSLSHEEWIRLAFLANRCGSTVPRVDNRFIG